MSAQIAIIGAGPSGCYLAQALLKSQPDITVDVIDALPVPYGLVRYGVAADHQGTKSLARQFERVFERQGARFFGNVTVGRDVNLAGVREAYDAVVLAAGLHVDRRLGIEGDEPANVIGAGALTRALFEHPDADNLPNLGPHPLIIGQGNVAIDVLRLLAKSPEELEGSDLGSEATHWLATSGIEMITIVGRSPAAQAKCDPVMIKELAKLSTVSFEMGDLWGADNPDGEAKLSAFAALKGRRGTCRSVRFVFEHVPLAIVPKGSDKQVRFATPDSEKTLYCSSIISAVGFDGDGVLPQAEPEEKLYATGWFANGPRGTIAQSRQNAAPLAERILATLSADPTKRGSTIFDGLPNVVDFVGWQRIDRYERAHAAPGRCRQKLAKRADIINVGRHEVQPTLKTSDEEELAS
ncbi:MAG: FAD-dependent oxidoreductase [Pseudomonadota bacterium]